MISQPLHTDTDAMRAHARRVSELSTGMSEAAQAGLTSAMPDNSFGILCSFLTIPATAIQLGAVAGLSAATNAMQGISTGLRSNADAFDTVDDIVAGVLKQLSGGQR